MWGFVSALRVIFWGCAPSAYILLMSRITGDDKVCFFLPECSVLYSRNGNREHFNGAEICATCGSQGTYQEWEWVGGGDGRLKAKWCTVMLQWLLLNTGSTSHWDCLLHTVIPNILTELYRFSNDILVHSISTGCPTLTQSRWAPSCHTWRGTNLTWQKWVGISVLLIKMGRVGKTFLKGHSIKEKAWGLFHSCFAHWPEPSSAAGNGVIGSVKARSTEGRFMVFRVLKKYTGGTAHTRRLFFCLFPHTNAEDTKMFKIYNNTNKHICKYRPS